jgi:DNA-binding NtrC family response regulator
MVQTNILVFALGQTSLEDAERELILKTIAFCGSKAEAARLLGVDPKTIYNKLHSFGSQGQRLIKAKAGVQKAS